MQSSLRKRPSTMGHHCRPWSVEDDPSSDFDAFPPSSFARVTSRQSSSSQCNSLSWLQPLYRNDRACMQTPNRLRQCTKLAQRVSKCCSHLLTAKDQTPSTVRLRVSWRPRSRSLVLAPTHQQMRFLSLDANVVDFDINKEHFERVERTPLSILPGLRAPEHDLIVLGPSHYPLWKVFSVKLTIKG